jgi:DNA-binding NarL/FixJ family response regulator
MRGQRLDQALRAFRRIGAAGEVARASACLRSLGVTPSAGPVSAGALTGRETEVLQLLRLGLSNPEIADRLYVSRKTVAHHVSRILGKLSLHSRAQAADSRVAVHGNMIGASASSREEARNHPGRTTRRDVAI